LRVRRQRRREVVDDIEVVAEADNGPCAVELARKHLVDVALLDIRMPGVDGLAGGCGDQEGGSADTWSCSLPWVKRITSLRPCAAALPAFLLKTPRPTT